jgi:predicted ATPase/class 3 adenylate cyclase
MVAGRQPSFGDLLRRYRVAAGLTQEELAERAGLSRRGISDLERGERARPRRETFQLLVQALSLSADEVARIGAATHQPSPSAGRPALDAESPAASAVRPAGTTTFLFTDLEGSTQLWQRHPLAMRSALARHDAILRTAIAAQRGHLVKATGDGVHAAFARASEAVTAAAEAQRGLLAEDWGETGSLRVRMALHTCEADERDGDYYGPMVNRAARLVAAGHGGQILLSATTCDLIRDALPAEVSLRDLGEHRLKDLARPERVYQLCAPGLPADFPALNSRGLGQPAGSGPSPESAFSGPEARLPAAPVEEQGWSTPDARHNLPISLTSFIGRESALADVSALLAPGPASSRLVTLTGAGGSGKTRLAIEVGRRLVDRFADGVWLVELAALADPAVIPTTVLAAMGGQEVPGRPPIETLTRYLRSQATLLILDNCEHLVSACAQLVETLLRSCPHLSVLATSREGLAVPGEVAWRVPSLAVPVRAETLTPERAAEFEAIRLFVERAASARSGFSLTRENVATVAQVCAQLDGIPMAIELAAARVKLLTIDQIVERLDDRFRLLTGGSRTALPRHRTLQALIDWSYDLLLEQERELLQRLSVFAGSFSLDAIEAVGGATDAAFTDVLDGVGQLVEKSLVEADDRGTEIRYRLLETVRQYARQHLEAAGLGDTVRTRHAQYYATLGEQAGHGLTHGEQLEWLERLDPDLGNLRGALDWLAERDPEASMLLLCQTVDYWLIRNYFHELHDRLTHLLERVTGPSVARARGLAVLCQTAAHGYDLAQAVSAGREAIVLGRATGDAIATAYGLAWLSHAIHYQGNTDRAIELCNESVSLWRANGESVGLGYALFLRALVTPSRDRESTRHDLAESREIFQRLGEYRGLAWCLGQIGRMACAEGDYAQAEALTEESHRHLVRLGDNASRIWRLGEWAEVARHAGNLGRARELVGEALHIGRGYGGEVVLRRVFNAAAFLALQTGELERGIQLLGITYHDADPRETLLTEEAAEYGQLVAAAEAQLGADQLKRLWADGAAMPLDATIDYAATGVLNGMSPDPDR